MLIELRVPAIMFQLVPLPRNPDLFLKRLATSPIHLHMLERKKSIRIQFHNNLIDNIFPKILKIIDLFRTPYISDKFQIFYFATTTFSI